MAIYGVARTFSTKREATKWAKEQRKAGYGARVTKTGDGYLVRRTNRLLK